MTESRSFTPPVSSIHHPTVGAAPEPTPVVVWDLDGTLVRFDTLVPFLWRLLGPAAFLPAATGAVTVPGRRWRLGAKARLLEAALAGREVRAVQRTAREYAAGLVAYRLRGACQRRWRWHRTQRHRLVIASASPQMYVREIGLLLGADEVLCTELEVAGGRYTGHLATPNCRGQEKARRLREYLTAHPGGRLWVYADGRVDAPALSMADVPVRVRPYLPLRYGDTFGYGTVA